jgi:NAD(P)-dependent dehydrogenase (short-subunit alcohol dehydrogenase family)
MQVDLRGQVAAIVGAGHGVGRAAARQMAKNGALVEELGGNPSVADLAGARVRRGRLDILVNVALGPEVAPTSIEGYCRGAADSMVKGGRIVNITSALGLVSARGEAGFSAACAAVLSLTRTLALEYGARGILVNAVAVGAHDDDGPRGERLLSHVPLARAGSSEEIAAAVLFLVDPDNSYTTGHVMTVDGGWSAGYARNF